MPQLNPATGLWDLIQSHRITMVIYVAAKLGIADQLRDQPKTLEQLTAATGAHEDALHRLLTVLSSLGICGANEGRFRLTEMGRALDGTAELSLKNWVIFEGEMLATSWRGMLETIKTGKTAAQLQGVGNSFELMARSPEKVGVFNAAMVDLTRLVTPQILAACDFSRIRHIMDVGGGAGELIGAIASKYPHIRGTAFDLARCAESANAHFAHIGIKDRAEFVAGDFFQSVPAIADAIVLKSVIHDWDDERSTAILKNCHKALPKHGKLLLVERVMPETPEMTEHDRSVAMSDLNMLRGPGGRERTEKQYRRLLDDSGFAFARVQPAGRFSVIEAYPG
jgi:SAM-dependent methyltransferase